MEDIFEDGPDQLAMGFIVDPKTYKPKLVMIVRSNDSDEDIQLVVGGQKEGQAMAETISLMAAQCSVLEDELEMADPVTYDEAVNVAIGFGKRVNAPYN